MSDIALVTGASGFVGRAAVREAQERVFGTRNRPLDGSVAYGQRTSRTRESGERRELGRAAGGNSHE
jgi:uncharacterized protein YbjT (DUF2867 family)